MMFDYAATCSVLVVAEHAVKSCANARTYALLGHRQDMYFAGRKLRSAGRKQRRSQTLKSLNEASCQKAHSKYGCWKGRMPMHVLTLFWLVHMGR